MHRFLTPNGFLKFGGFLLLTVGLLGYFGITGPTPDKSVFGTFWWFDNIENLAHSVLGIIAILAAFILKDAETKKLLTISFGVFMLLVALYNLTGTTILAGATLQSPMDLILHAALGVWALAAGLLSGKKEAKEE